MRKEADFNVTDHIRVFIRAASEKLADILNGNRESIMSDTLSDEMKVCFGGDQAVPAEEAYTKDWDVNGEEVTIAVAKI